MKELKKEQQVILWGCGDGGQYAFENLKNRFNIVAFGDNSIQKVGTEYMGNPVLSSTQVINEYKDAIVLNTVMSKPHEEIKKELRQKGIENEIYHYTDFLKVNSVEDRRNECADFHIDNMEKYFQGAEAQKSLDIFWSDKSPFKQLFDKLDVTSVVELACGRGRHVPQYMNKANAIILVDILQKNIDFCKDRFQGIDKIRYYTNSGCDLREIENNSITAIFSYDAMVHFESIDVYHYLQETYRILEPGGMALYHHSNNDKDYKATFLSGECGRNYMSMGLFAHFADRAGLKVVDQVKYKWTDSLTDGITLLKKE